MEINQDMEINRYMETNWYMEGLVLNDVYIPVENWDIKIKRDLEINQDMEINQEKEINQNTESQHHSQYIINHRYKKKPSSIKTMRLRTSIIAVSPEPNDLW